MPEPYSPEDEAARYVLNEFTDEERREFESRLAQSSELRTLVGELEEGAVALSLASSGRRPPPQVWTRIEKTVKGMTRREAVPAFWTRWWRSGWAAATACLIGWLLYAFWANHSGPPDPSVSVATGTQSQPVIGSPDPPWDKTAKVPWQEPAPNNTVLELLQARAQEVGALRWQIFELTNQMTRYSQALNHQQALLSESSRLKFFQLAPPAAGSNATSPMPVSPELQRAMLIAMGRQLGWMTSAPPVSSAAPEPTRINYEGVNFVDLRPGSNSPPASIASPQVDPPQVETHPVITSEPASVASAPTNAIPGFVSGTNAVLAFDTSVAAAHSELTFLRSAPDGQNYSLGTAVLGDNPMVVTIPFVASSQLSTITVIGATAQGGSNLLGQFSTQGLLLP